MQNMRVQAALQIQGAVTVQSPQERFADQVASWKQAIAVSGAGGGKTTLLGMVVARLLEVGVEPERIAAMTFTNEAAYRLRTELFRRKGEIDILKRGNISTIHSFCASILRENLRRSGLRPGFRIVENDRLVELKSMAFQSALQELGADSDVDYLFGTMDTLKKRRDLADTISRMGDGFLQNGLQREMAATYFERGLGRMLEALRGLGASQSLIDDVTRRWKGLLKCFDVYFKKLEELKEIEGLITYTDILYRTYNLLNRYPEIASKYRERYRLLIVDEFQDTDRLQSNIIELTSQDSSRAYAGDSRQSIYGWRNADPSIMEEMVQKLELHCPEAVVKLNVNYRSSPGLVAFFNRFFRFLFEGSGIRYEDMEPAKKIGERDPVRIIKVRGAKKDEMRRDEAQRICDEIKALKNQDVAYGDIAILFRSARSMHIYQSVLRENGIPFVASHGGSLFDTDEVRDVMSFLGYVATRNPFFAAASLRSPMFGVEDKLIFRMACAADFDVALKEVAHEDRGTALFMELADFCTGNCSMSPPWLIEEIYARTKLPQIYLAAKGRQAYANLMRFQAIVSNMGKVIEGGIDELFFRLQDMARGGQEFEAMLGGKGAKAVSLMTIHASKGLEFPVVFLADTYRKEKENGEVLIADEEGVIWTGVVEDEQLSEAFRNEMARERYEEEKREERRVTYVAMTRAERLLYISLSEERDDNNFTRWMWNFLEAAGYTRGEREISIDGMHVVSFAAGNVAGEAEFRAERKGLKRVELNHPPSGIDISATALASLLVCPYRYVLWKEGAEPHPWEMLVSTNRGKEIHERLAREEPSALMKAFPALHTRIFRDAVEGYSEGRLRRELPFRLKEGTVSISGKIDALVLKDEESIVIDYKTGNVEMNRSEYEQQLLIYALAVMKLFSPKKVRVALIALDHGEQGFERTVEQKELRDLAETIDRTGRSILIGSPDARPSLHSCAHCEYRRACSFSLEK